MPALPGNNPSLVMRTADLARRIKLSTLSRNLRATKLARKVIGCQSRKHCRAAVDAPVCIDRYDSRTDHGHVD